MFAAALVAAALAGVVATTGCTATGTADPTPVAHVQPATTPRLEGADNFRDVGGLGEGYRTTDGGHVARGVVYRSNALTLTDADLAALAKLDVTDVIDLRTTPEIEAKPDTEIPGATWVHDDVLGSVASLATPTFETAAEAEALMDGAYESMVTSADARKAIGAALTTIAEAKGAVIVHCTAGKDRTGWTSALLLHIAGADQQTIDQNYLLTNQYSRASISAALKGMTETSGEATAAAYAPLLGVQQSFLDASYTAVGEHYGSVDAYLTEGLGLSKDTIEKLRTKLTA
ncbi:tyrosine-protein phosphatase [Leifsonia shinshuensis]|uniref:Protein-tyrosine phosphatase n=1 Tax=Leifsonia shinshuensis TaxID=150026 RepID=A0A853CU79_9MICO|nr:tyrosine-protein phosphatase [Leifsonia shinshuensis]NYJ23463.1 protein-tyrosine phosphatase [Leifsonia shinshuensis]